MKKALKAVAVIVVVWLGCGLAVYLLGVLRRSTGSFSGTFTERAPTRAPRALDDPSNGTQPPERSGTFTYEIVEEAGGLTLTTQDNVLIRGCRIHGRFLPDSHEAIVNNQSCMVTLSDGSPAQLDVTGTFGLPKNPFVRSIRGTLVGSARPIGGPALPLPFASESYELTWPR